LNIGNGSIDDDGLMRSLNDAPPQSIILLEDVDGIFNQRESVSQDEEGRGVSFSGLLNALDGVRSQEGRILFMTTNHIERLDPALIRPGRCDIQIELKNATFSMVERLFLKFFPGEEKKASEFSKLIPESKISMAKLQGHFLKYRNDVNKVLDHYKETLTQEQ
jgi:chaperone BCS1